MQAPYGGRTVAQAYNPWTGTYAATAQGHNAYAQWGSSVVTQGDDWTRTGHITTAQGGTAGYRTSDGGAGRVVYGPQGAAGVAKTANDDIYAGKDGNVYKRDSNGNWSKYDNGNWDPVDKSSGGQHKTGGGDSTLKSRQGRRYHRRPPTNKGPLICNNTPRRQPAKIAKGSRQSPTDRPGKRPRNWVKGGAGAARYGGGRRR